MAIVFLASSGEAGDQASAQAHALVDALLTLFAIGAGPAVFASGLLACVALYAPPLHNRDSRIAAAVDLGVAVAFPYGAIFGFLAFVHQLANANVPS